jgi:hypothetical protein
VTREASQDLREIAATHSPLVIDLVAWLIRLLYTQGYGRQLYYDRDQLAEVKALAQQNPVVFLPSHKSNLDHLVLQYALHENGHAPNHTAGGINMNFFPVGPLVRRSGTFFIRRSFRDDEIYKFVLHHYIDYLIEKRFSLEWYIEGGRSRSGKLLPPKFGMLAYVVDAYRRGKSEDVFLIPVSIAYDQIQDVGGYAAEQRGGAKARRLRLVPRRGAPAAPPLREHPHPLRRAALAGEDPGPPGSGRGAQSRRAEPGIAEARLRGRGAHQPGDADHVGLAGDARAARHRRPGAHGWRGAQGARQRAALHAPARASDGRRARPRRR